MTQEAGGLPAIPTQHDSQTARISYSTSVTKPRAQIKTFHSAAVSVLSSCQVDHGHSSRAICHRLKHQDQQNKVNKVCSKFAPAHTELCSIPQVRSAGSFKCLALNSMICTVCARLEVAFIRVDPTVPQKLQNMMQRS